MDYLAWLSLGGLSVTFAPAYFFCTYTFLINSRTLSALLQKKEQKHDIMDFKQNHILTKQKLCLSLLNNEHQQEKVIIKTCCPEVSAVDGPSFANMFLGHAENRILS